MLGQPIVELEALSVKLDGRWVIPELSLQVSRAERLCIVGQARSGKSLLLELMAGRHVPHQGHLSYPAWVDEYPDAALGVVPRFAVQLVSTHEQHRICAQYATFHQARWHASFTEPSTVDEFLGPESTHGLRPFEVPPDGLIDIDHDEHRSELLAELGIDYLLTRRVAALSNGEWRKLLLARALLARPRLLLLDDPLGGLDPEARSRVLDVLQRQCARQRVSAASRFFKRTAPTSGEALTVVFTSPRPEELSTLLTRSVELEATCPSVPRRPAERIRGMVTVPQCQLALPGDVRCVLSLRAATVRAGATTLLDGVSLQIARGEHWLITGPNGAGKSTLLALLMGDHPQSYVVDLEVLGLRAKPGVSLFERQRRIGYMAPELATHYPGLWSVKDVVLSGLNASIGQFVAASDAECQLAEHWLERLDMNACASRPLSTLSEVELRKVFLARALVRKPALLILDEPTQGLAEAQRAEVIDVLDQVVAESNLSLIIVSHHALARPQCVTHHLALDKGRVVHCGRLSDAA